MLCQKINHKKQKVINKKTYSQSQLTFNFVSKKKRDERDRYIEIERQRRIEKEREEELERQREFEEEKKRINTENRTIEEEENERLRQENEELKRKLFAQSEADSRRSKYEDTTDSDEKSRNQERKRKSKSSEFDNLEEVESGEQITYKIVVKTGDRLGASTEADVSIQLFGERGKSRPFPLKKSKLHKLPFRKSNTDVFEIETLDVGDVKAIQIGHSEPEIEYSWYMDYLRVEDHLNNISYNFECKDWFSSNSDDRKTSRILVRNSLTEISSDLHETSSGRSSVSVLSKQKSDSGRKERKESRAEERRASVASSKNPTLILRRVIWNQHLKRFIQIRQQNQKVNVHNTEKCCISRITT